MSTTVKALVRLRDQGIADDDGGVGRVRWAKELSNNDEGCRQRTRNIRQVQMIGDNNGGGRG